MIEEVKCACGHANPPGTMLCESCGAPREDMEGKIVDMRYEGVMRRSQASSQTITGRIWRFFSSVRNAIIMIVLTLMASAIGTIFPQEQYIPVPKHADVFYEEAYGTLGLIYYRLGLHHLYSSWWFIALLLGIGISLVVCSVDRVQPLYRALKAQRVKRDHKFLAIQKVSTEIDIGERGSQEVLDALKQGLSKRRYNVREEDNALLGERGRFSRWGPYINHIGLILFLVGCLLRLIPGFYLNQFVWVREGQTEPVPETKYYVKNERFDKVYYQDNEFPEKLDINGRVVKEYKTTAVLYENENAGVAGTAPKLKEVKKAEIRVNHPLEQDDLLLYQSGEQENELQALNMKLVNTATHASLGTVRLDLYKPQSEIRVSDHVKVQVLKYFPDFALDKNKQPITKTTSPNNPAFVINTISPKTPNGEKQWIFLGSTLTANQKPPVVTYEFAKPDLVNVTGLMVRVDKSLPVIFFGACVCMVGLVMGFYWQHRRIWLEVVEGRLLLAAHTNKNWFGMKQEIIKVLDSAGFTVSVAQLEKGEKKS